MTNRLRSKERDLYATETTEFNQFMYIDYVLNQNETLHTLSMKFAVSIPDLKRINSLQNDRDLFALKIIKIPIKPNSIYTETYAGQIKYGSYSMNRLNSNNLLTNNIETKQLESEDDRSSEDLNSNNNFVEVTHDNFNSDNEISTTTPLLGKETNINENRIGINKESINSKKQSKEAKRFLKKFDNNLESLKSQNNELISVVQNTSDIEQLVPVSNADYSVEKRGGNFSNGIFNINVRDVLIIACIVVILLPLGIFIYRYLYLKEHPQYDLINSINKNLNKSSKVLKKN